MNAKELRQAAESRLDASDGVMRLIGATDADLEADIEGIGLKVKQDRACYRHILATVREDDDELVTEEWLETFCERKTARTFAVKSLEVFTRTKDVWLCNPATGERYASIKTRGQFRSLCRGLGIELKEQQ